MFLLSLQPIMQMCKNKGRRLKNAELNEARVTPKHVTSVEKSWNQKQDD
jgi:hypothetical protein